MVRGHDLRDGGGQPFRVVITAHQRVEYEAVDCRHDRRSRGGTDMLGSRGNEPFASTDERGLQRTIASRHQEQLVTGERQGPASPEPVLEHLREVAVDCHDVPLGETLEERPNHRTPVAEVVADRAVRQPRTVLGRADGEAGGTGLPEELEGCVEQADAGRLLQAEKNTW